MSERLFTSKEPYLKHLLRKQLGKLNRKYLRENLEDQDVIIYTDYSKGNCISQANYYLITVNGSKTCLTCPNHTKPYLT